MQLRKKTRKTRCLQNAIETLEIRRLLSLPYPLLYPDQPSFNPGTSQTGMDIFSPTLSTSAPSSSAPVIAQYTQSGNPGQALTISVDQLSGYTGTSFGEDTQFVVYAQTTSGNAIMEDATIERLSGNLATILLPSNLPTNSAYMIWAENDISPGVPQASYPVVVNHAQAWWIGPGQQSTPSEQLIGHPATATVSMGTTVLTYNTVLTGLADGEVVLITSGTGVDESGTIQSFSTMTGSTSITVSAAWTILPSPTSDLEVINASAAGQTVTAAEGQTLNVFGDNLSNGASTPLSWVYLQPTGGGMGTWDAESAASVNPYDVQFTAPSTAGTYQVWVHNGHGGAYGWSLAPQTLNVVAPTTAFGGVGTTISILTSYTTSQIQSAITNASSDFGTVYFAPGTYTVTSPLTVPSNVRILGAGAGNTTIDVGSTIFDGGGWTPTSTIGIGVFNINASGTPASATNNVEITGLTLNANGNLDGLSTGANLINITQAGSDGVPYDIEVDNDILEAVDSQVDSGIEGPIPGDMLDGTVTGSNANWITQLTLPASNPFVTVANLTSDVNSNNTVLTFSTVLSDVQVGETVIVATDSTVPSAVGQSGTIKSFTETNTTTTITLNTPVWTATADSNATIDLVRAYTGDTVSIVSGDGKNETGTVEAINGTVLTLGSHWSTLPDASSVVGIAYASPIHPLQATQVDNFFLNNCTIIGAGDTIGTPSLNSAQQVFVNGCMFYATNNASGMLTPYADIGVSITNCTGQSYNNTSLFGSAIGGMSQTSGGPGGTDTSGQYWGLGRFVAFEQVANDDYVANDTTLDLHNIGNTANGGEHLLWETGGSGFVSTDTTGVNTSGITVLTFNSPWASSIGAGDVVSVVGGDGLGESGIVTSVTAVPGTATTQITLDRQWAVLPDSTSIVTVGSTTYSIPDRVAVYDNSLDGDPSTVNSITANGQNGIITYNGADEFIADGNTINEVRTGINDTGRTYSNSVNNSTPTLFALYQNNTVSNTQIGFQEYEFTGDSPSVGMSFAGDTFRNNVVENALTAGILLQSGTTGVYSRATPWMDMTVIQGNTISSAPIGLDEVGVVSGSMANLVLLGNTFSGPAFFGTPTSATTTGGYTTLTFASLPASVTVGEPVLVTSDPATPAAVNETAEIQSISSNTITLNTAWMSPLPDTSTSVIEIGLGNAGTVLFSGETPVVINNTWTNYLANLSGAVPGPVLELPQRTVAISVETGQSAVVPLNIQNAGTATLNWNLSANQTWLQFSSTNGALASQTASSGINLTANAVTLAAGSYTGIITVYGAHQTEQIEVYLTVNAVTLPTVSVAATTPNASEAGPVDGVFTFTRAVSTSSPLIITYSESGTAINGTDYTMLSGTVTIAANSTSSTVTIVPSDLTGPSRTAILTINPNASAYYIDQPSDTVTIAPYLPQVSVVATAPTAYVDTPTGAVDGTYVFSRSYSNSSPLTIDYTITGTAVNGVNYTTFPTTATIAANSTTDTISLAPINLMAPGPSLTSIVSIYTPTSPPYGILANQGTATVTIDNSWNSLVSNITFDTNSAADSTHYANNGTLTGTPLPIYSTNTPTGTGDSILFPGTGTASVTIPASSSLNNQNNVTIGLWVDGPPNTAFENIFDKTSTLTVNSTPGLHLEASGTDAGQDLLLQAVTAPVNGNGNGPSSLGLSSVAGGAMSQTTYYVEVTYVGPSGESSPSTEASQLVGVNDVLSIASPSASSGYTGYNVYLGKSTGTEVLVNTQPIPLSTNWTEPTGGYTPYVQSVTLPYVLNNTWNYVAFTLSDGVMDAYLNGVLAATSTYEGGFGNSNPIILGNRNYLFAKPFNGNIDNFSFYDRALTPGEIQSLYKAEQEPVVSVEASVSNAYLGGSTPGLFTISTGAPVTSTLVVDYTLSGSASQGTNYTTVYSGSYGTATLTPGSSSVTVTINPLYTTTPTTAVLTLSTASGYLIGSGSDTVTIQPSNNPALVDYLTFNQSSGSTATDSSGYGNTGTLSTNAPTWSTSLPTTPPQPLNEANSINFNSAGSGQYVEVNNSASLDTSGSDLTLSFWVDANGSANSYGRIASKLTSTVGWEVTTNSNSIEFSVETSAGSGYILLPSVLTGSWEYITVTANNGVITGYVDANTAGMVTGSYPVGGGFGNTANLFLGIRGDLARPFNGNLLNFQYYDVALSSAAVASLYAQQ